MNKTLCPLLLLLLVALGNLAQGQPGNEKYKKATIQAGALKTKFNVRDKGIVYPEKKLPAAHYAWFYGKR